MGYKAALCERDIAIYGMMPGRRYSRACVTGCARAAVVYLILGLMPLAGRVQPVVQLPPFEFWPVRETLPPYRVITGALFGLMNVWLAFPYLEISMNDTIESIGAKLEAAQQRLTALESTRQAR